MPFVSIPFLGFFTAVFVIFYLIPLSWRVAFLVGASLFFMACASPFFLIYSSVFLTVNYFVGGYISNKKAHFRKPVYYFGQTFNLGGLIVYKYSGFAVDNINLLLGAGFKSALLPHLDLIIPLGISYYTFQGLSYLYLIFKANDKPEPSFVNLGLYMLFFPKIMAGPIERHRFFLPQLAKALRFDYSMAVEGGRLFLWGMFKSVVVGNTMGDIINRVHADIDHYNWIALTLVFLLQPIYLYFDFSGYTDMAIGIARFFGIRLSPNFLRPFFSKSIGEFWRRWHISLSSWCNDFIYNRYMIKYRKLGSLGAIIAITITFLVIGIWHGANWTFVVVGGLQVLALIYEFLTKKWRANLVKTVKPVWMKWGSRVLVYLFFSLTLLFFFSKDIGESLLFLNKISNVHLNMDFSLGLEISPYQFAVGATIAMAVLYFEYLSEDRKYDFGALLASMNRWGRWPMYVIMIVLIVYFSQRDTQFVYVNF